MTSSVRVWWRHRVSMAGARINLRIKNAYKTIYPGYYYCITGVAYCFQNNISPGRRMIIRASPRSPEYFVILSLDDLHHFLSVFRDIFELDFVAKWTIMKKRLRLPRNIFQHFSSSRSPEDFFTSSADFRPSLSKSSDYRITIFMIIRIFSLV